MQRLFLDSAPYKCCLAGALAKQRKNSFIQKVDEANGSEFSLKKPFGHSQIYFERKDDRSLPENE